MDGHSLACLQGFEDQRYATLYLLRGGRGEIPDGQVRLPQPVSFEAGQVVGPLVEIDQQPYATVRERG